VGGELFHEDGQTDRQTYMKLVVAFRNFVKAPKNDERVKSTNVSVILRDPDYSVNKLNVKV
jgi:hypothetical protein